VLVYESSDEIVISLERSDMTLLVNSWTC